MCGISLPRLNGLLHCTYLNPQLVQVAQTAALYLMVVEIGAWDMGQLGRLERAHLPKPLFSCSALRKTFSAVSRVAVPNRMCAAVGRVEMTCSPAQRREHFRKLSAAVCLKNPGVICSPVRSDGYTFEKYER